MIQKRELKAFAEPLGLADHGGGRVLQPSPDEVRGPIVEEHVAAVEERRITMAIVVEEDHVRVRWRRVSERILWTCHDAQLPWVGHNFKGHVQRESSTPRGQLSTDIVTGWPARVLL